MLSSAASWIARTSPGETGGCHLIFTPQTSGYASASQLAVERPDRSNHVSRPYQSTAGAVGPKRRSASHSTRGPFHRWTRPTTARRPEEATSGFGPAGAHAGRRQE